MTWVWGAVAAIALSIWLHFVIKDAVCAGVKEALKEFDLESPVERAIMSALDARDES